MASSLYRVQRTSTPGTDLLVTLNVINEAFAKLKLLRAAMIQQKDGSAGTAADYVTPAAVFGFVDSDNALSSTVAKAAFEELDSFVSNGGPSLEQCCARFKQ